MTTKTATERMQWLADSYREDPRQHQQVEVSVFKWL